MKFVPWPRNDRDLLAMRKRVDVSSKTMFFVPFLQRDRKTGASVKVIYHSIQEEGLWTYGILKLAFSEFKKHENSRTCRMPALRHPLGRSSDQTPAGAKQQDEGYCISAASKDFWILQIGRRLVHSSLMFIIGCLDTWAA